MEVYTHSTVIDRVEYLQSGLHDEFLHPDILSLIERDPFLLQKLRRSKEVENDTIFSYDEIPLVKESKTHTCIFQEGTLLSVTDYLTPYRSNVLFHLNENLLSEEKRISRTVEKNGFLKIYNTRGELIVKELFPFSNMKDFLDIMKLYVDKCEKKTPYKKDKEILSFLEMKKKLPVGSRISRLPNGHVLMEIRLKSLPKEMKFLSWASGFLKSRTELSEDMTKILKFELFHGDYLVQRKVYAYNDKVALRNFHHNDVVGSSPESIECEYIMLDSKGLPVLHHTKEFFYRNQIYYHFDD